MAAQVYESAHKCALDVGLCMRDIQYLALAALVRTEIPARQANKYLKPLLENLQLQ